MTVVDYNCSLLHSGKREEYWVDRLAVAIMESLS